MKPRTKIMIVCIVGCIVCLAALLLYEFYCLHITKPLFLRGKAIAVGDESALGEDPFSIYNFHSIKVSEGQTIEVSMERRIAWISGSRGRVAVKYMQKCYTENGNSVYNLERYDTWYIVKENGRWTVESISRYIGPP